MPPSCDTPTPDTRPFDPAHLRRVLGQFATGVTVVTTADAEGALGMTANSFASVSLEPPLVLWSPARASRRCAGFAAARHSSIHILRDDQVALAQQIARDGRDFSGVDWDPGRGGTPLIADCLARLDLTAHAQHDGGDHLILVARVEAVTLGHGTPLVFAQGSYGRPAPFARD